MKKFYIKTFGCQMNVHDSEKMAGILTGADYAITERPDDADILIFNTCSIRHKAEQKFFSYLGRFQNIKKKRPDVKIVVAGCIAQQEDKKIFSKAPFVDHVIGPQNIMKIRTVTQMDKRSTHTYDNPFIIEEESAVVRDSRVRAWVNIMYGCDNFCSYCVVPYTRGREQSRSSDRIINEVTRLVDEGFKEICLLGQNVNSYSADTNFVGLLKKLNKISGIERIRFMTSHPRDLSDELIRAFGDLEKLCEHMHLPLQSGSNRVLGLMNRGYNYSEYKEKVERLRSVVPDIAITTDIIAGFPTETELEHKDTVKALKEIKYDGIFAFKYSPRPMTKATEMDGHLDEKIKTDWLNEILGVQDRITDERNRALMGSVLEVLTDIDMQTGYLAGRTRMNKIVNFRDTEGLTPGMLITAKIVNTYKHSLEAEIIT
ncbi:MAG: tRNA (N6-isopentenyl adenosine(37)-C2)-methylthiotransferase MiaB [Thermoplasmata archaeon M9B2D]|nr:MAG: tRNA (N6-isopentenyl adenosine(37)-C2)-methylthiotransferase MiaB [Thermoplasmata archaeon M9B2D]